MKHIGPDDSWCKKCGEPVRYGNISGRNIGVAFDVKPVTNGGYQLIEEDDGKWTATYTRLDNREPGGRGYRHHSCHLLRNDNLGYRPVLVKGIWTLIQEGV